MQNVFCPVRSLLQWTKTVSPTQSQPVMYVLFLHLHSCINRFHSLKASLCWALYPTHQSVPRLVLANIWWNSLYHPVGKTLWRPIQMEMRPLQSHSRNATALTPPQSAVGLQKGLVYHDPNPWLLRCWMTEMFMFLIQCSWPVHSFMLVSVVFQIYLHCFIHASLFGTHWCHLKLH